MKEWKLFLFMDRPRMLGETARIFNEWHPNRNVVHSYVQKLITKFTNTGSVSYKRGTVTE